MPQVQPEYGDEQADVGRDCRTASRETKFSGASGDRKIYIFPCSADHEQDWQNGSCVQLDHHLHSLDN